jgi:hypothetical protein
MVEFTFLEIHLDDSSLTANAPYSHGEKEVTASDEPPAADETGGGSKKKNALAAVIGLVFLAAVAYLAKRKFLEEGDELEELLGDEDEADADDTGPL